MTEQKIKYFKISRKRKCLGGAFVKPRKKFLVVKTLQPKKKKEEGK